MDQYYLLQNDEQRGPFTLNQLRSMWGSGSITSQTLFFQQGFAEWVPLSMILDRLEPNTVQTESHSLDSTRRATDNLSEVLSGAREIGVNSFQKVKGSASKILSDLGAVDFKEEVFPVNKQLIECIVKENSFWTVMGLAAVPLLITTLERVDFQLTAFALFFAALWGVVFKSQVVRSDTNWKYLALSLFFTGTVGIPFLLLSYHKFLPAAYTAMASSNSGVTSLFGYILQVGVCEELVKIIPTVVYLAWKRKSADPLSAILIGIFSGLGFAAFENMSYGQSAILQSALLAKKAGVLGAAAGTRGAMINVMLRSLSLVFCHATFTGIFAYFVTTGFATGKRFIAMTLIGLSVSAVLHGAYDWLTAVQMTMATGVVVLSFVLFYSYLTKIKQLLGSDSSTN